MRLYFLFIFLGFNSLVYSQPSLLWSKALSGTTSEIAYSVKHDKNGNVYTTGIFTGTTDFDPGPGTFTYTVVGNSDIFITKQDPLGNLIWAKKIGGTLLDYSYSIDLDQSGNVYICGAFAGAVDFDPGPASYSITAIGSFDIFVLKLNSAGNFVWAKRIGSTASEMAYALNVSKNDNVYLVGFYTGLMDFDPGPGLYYLNGAAFADIFLCKFNSSGVFKWASSFGGGTYDYPFGVTTDSLENIYGTGSFNGSGDFDPSAATYSLTASGLDDAFVFKLDSVGKFKWARQMGSTTGNDQAKGISCDRSGNVYTTGFFDGVADFDPGSGVFNLNSATGTDAYVSKLDSLGNFVWARQLGSPVNNDRGQAISNDKKGNVYTTGYFQGTGDFDPSVASMTLTSIGNNDVFVSKLDSAGSFVWAGAMGGGFIDQGQAIDVDSIGDIYVAGYFNSVADLDPGPGSYTISAAGMEDVFINKLASCPIPSQPSAISGLNSFCSGSGTQTYSVSSSAGANFYSWTAPSGWTGTSTTNIISVLPNSNSGILSVTATNTCGTTPATVLNVTVNPLPVVSVSTSSVCVGTLGCLFANAPSAVTYTWVGPCGFVTTSPSPCITFNSFCNCTYTVTVADANSCVNSSTTCLNIYPNPTVSAVTSNSILCGPPFQGTANITASGAISYTWSTSSNSSVIAVSPSVTTNYTVIGSDMNGCQNSTVITQSVSSCTGVEQFTYANSEIVIFPNPTKESLKIIVTESFIENSIEIYNVLGECIFKTEIREKRIDVDLSKESSGIYFAKIDNRIIKVIKE